MKSSVVVAVFNETRDQILLIKRRDVPIWALPGGGIDENESAEKAALREIEEETGLQVAISRKVAEYSPINQLSFYTHFFECQYLGGVPITGPETKEVAFFSYKSLPQPFFFLHEEWIQDTLKNHDTLIHKPIEQVTYFNLLKYFFRHPLWVSRLVLSRLGIPLNSR